MRPRRSRTPAPGEPVGPRRGANRIRIIGGLWRGRIIRVPAAGVRPTPDRIRETLFNWLGQDLTGLDCLDLFAGSGALGFEALSRGARSAVLVDASRSVCGTLSDTARALGAVAGRIECADALEFARSTADRFDVVFLDPPYASGLLPPALDAVPRLMKPGGRVYAESDEPLSPPAGWRVTKSGSAGAVRFFLLEWGHDDKGSVSGHV